MRSPPVSRSLRVILSVGAVLALAACGGGGDSGTTTLTFAPSISGTLHASGAPNGLSGIRIGQDANEGLRGGLRFPLFPFVDAGDTILSAKLRVRQTGAIGVPYSVHGVIVVDYVDLGPGIDATDYNAPVLASNLGTLSSDTTLGFKEIDVTAQVAAAAAANDFTIDFIARFTALVLSPGEDYAEFADHLDGADAPQLVVTYQ